MRQRLAERIYFTAGLLAHQLTVSRKKPMKKSSLRFLVNFFFFQGNEIPVRDGRGPKSELTEKVVIAAVKKLGGRPSRNKLAIELQKAPSTLLEWVRKKGFENLDKYLNSLEDQSIKGGDN
jgi:hypothetical protein